jgi:tetraacyldisaccharide 4'-kinase
MKRPWLAPLTSIYSAALAMRNLRIDNGWEPVRRLRFPVISIGNLSTGGAGKTPLTIALANALTQRGFHVDVLSRGYGRQSQLPARVNPEGAAEEYGDEPLLIARAAGVPVYVAAERYRAGQLAEAESLQAAHESRRTVHLLDDGFQHRQLARTIDILLLNQADWRDSLLPAGNLREPIAAAHRASVIAIPAEEPQLETELKAWGWHGPIWRLHRKMEVPAVLSGAVAAFCGIARPHQFFAGLESAGLRLASRVSFRDHHRYTAADIHRLLSAAQKAGATALITTEKDHVRLGSLASAFPASIPLQTARLFLTIEDQDQALHWLQDCLNPAPSEPPL